jgi:hypothetical protein
MIKSHIINTLPNIQGLDIIRKKLKTAKFIQFGKKWIKEIRLSQKFPIHKLIQIIPEKESVDISAVTKRISQEGYEGYLLPTYLLKESLKQNPLPISEEKQRIIEHICKMNNNKYNEAEGIHIVYKQHEALNPLVHPEVKKRFLSPNLPSQVISAIHKHDSSRLTIGEAKSYRELPKPYPYGEAIIQISHLRYHVLDLDMSIEITEENQSEPLKEKVSIFESCYSFPFKLNQDKFSDHGFIIYIKGENITPEKICKIIGLKNTGFGGIAVGTGTITSTILTKTKKRILKKEEFKNKTFTRKDKEAVGSFSYDPFLDITQYGYCDLERNGKLESLDGEFILAFYPFHQTFIGEYK